jgi:Flp pilus assembly protein TadG
MLLYLSKLLKNYERDERGSFSILLMVMFTTLVLIAGAGIDLVRYEAVRSSIQYNLDRAVLAAASMRAQGEPKDIVENYMSTVASLEAFEVNMDDANTNVTVTGRRVAATASAELNTYFLKLAGIDTMGVQVSSQASEEIPNLEISMVLDVSGSMLDQATGGGTKMSKLRTAAVEFIDAMVTNSPQGSVASVSIVPYSSNVSLPQGMWNIYNTEDLHTERRCALFDDATYGTAAVSTSTELRQLSYFNKEGEYFGMGSQPSVPVNYDWCSDSSTVEILPFSTDDIALKSYINNMQAVGGTSTHIGTKWVVALLDPAASTVAANLGSADANGRPYAYNTPNVLKVLVVMTDGINSGSHRVINEGYRTAPPIARPGHTPELQHASDYWEVKLLENVVSCTYNWMVWYYENYGWYNFYCDEETTIIDKKFVKSPTSDSWYEFDLYNTAFGSYSELPGDPDQTDPNAVGYQKTFTWPEVWKMYTIDEFADEAYASTNVYYGSDSNTANSDALMRQSCTAAINQGVLVYTIGFEATATRQLLQDCASATSNYYDVNGTNIADAFASIAVSIQKLRLTL